MGNMDIEIRINYPSDRDSLYLICDGGVRFAKRSSTEWFVEPVFNGVEPVAKGVISGTELGQFLKENRLRRLAIRESFWRNGSYGSLWLPLNERDANFAASASVIWRNIAVKKIAGEIKSKSETLNKVSDSDFGKIVDLISEKERFFNYISSSLLSSDESFQRILDFCNRSLIREMRCGNFDVKSFNIDYDLYADVLSFFVSLGSARDYLGAMIAERIGKDPSKIDSMAKLLNVLSVQHVQSDTLLKCMLDLGVVKIEESGHVKSSGWMAQFSAIRNSLVHKRPFGSLRAERESHLEIVNRSIGLYKYHRNIEMSDGILTDLMTEISGIYINFNNLFYHLHDCIADKDFIFTITDDDVVA